MTTSKVCLGLCLAFLFPAPRAQLQCPSVCSCVLDLNGDGIIDCSNRGLTDAPTVYIPGTFKIAKVDLSRNELTNIDINTLYAYIVGLTVLELDFSFNSISNISGSFDAQTGRDFETLNLSSNAFTTFPLNVIPVNHHRSKLVIDISHNQLTELTSQMFAGGNDIFIPGFQFFALNNSINKIADDAFQGVDLVDTVIDLRFNRLMTLSPGFESPRGVQTLKLSGNPWHCDCKLRWIIQANRFLVNYTALDPPNCLSPPSLLDRPVFSLKAGEFACLPYQQGSLTLNVTNESNYTLTCPVTADPPNPEISWDMWVPCSGTMTPRHFAFTAETITVNDVQTTPNIAFRCTARNNAGSITFDLDVRYNDHGGTSLSVPHSTTTVFPTSNGNSTQMENPATTRSMSSRGEFSSKVPSTASLPRNAPTTKQQKITSDGGLITNENTDVGTTLSRELREESSIMTETSNLPEVTNTTVNSIKQASHISRSNINIEHGGKVRNGTTEGNCKCLTVMILLAVLGTTVCI